MKNKIGMMAFSLLMLASCSNEKGFVLDGTVPEAWDGKQVVLYTQDTGTLEAVDSTVVRNGHFSLQGEFSQTRYCQVKIYLNPKDRRSYDMTPSFDVFLDSTRVDAVAERQNKNVLFSVNEGDSNSEWKEYQQKSKIWSDKRKMAFDRYIETFYQQELQKEGIDAAREVTARTEELAQFRKDHIRSHPESMVSVQVFNDLLESTAAFNKMESLSLFRSLAPSVRESVPGQRLLEKIQMRKIEMGAPCPDIEVEDRQGKVLSLSSLIADGSYTLVEIWASWCSPCRGEIPFIRRAYKKYHDQGLEVVSISINTDREDWEKALEQEKMPWHHVLDPTQKSFEAFETRAVPTSLLVGPDGRIVRTNARGGWLDAALEEIFDK